MSTIIYNEDGSISEKDVKRFAVLRHQHHRDIRRAAGCGMTTIRSVLTALQSGVTEKGQRILAEAEKIMKDIGN
jgi:hypothetical protein